MSMKPSNFAVWAMAVLMVICLLVAASEADECGNVENDLDPCLSYLTTARGATPPTNCCNRVKDLDCPCIKKELQKISNLNAAKAAALPVDCDLNPSSNVVTAGCFSLP